MAYSPHPSRAKKVPVTVSSGAFKTSFVVDQTRALPPGRYFRPVETVDLQADVDTVVRITNANTAGFVILDALQVRRE